MKVVFPVVLVAFALAAGAFLVVDGNRRSRAERSPSRNAAVSASASEARDVRAQKLDAEMRAAMSHAAIEPRARPEAASPPPPAARKAAKPAPKPEPKGAATARPPTPSGPCEGELRITGSFHAPKATQPLVSFSGQGGRRIGLRTLGGYVAGKTIVAIYPDLAVLRDPQGQDCWVKMTSQQARAVAATEQRVKARPVQAAKKDERAKKKATTRKPRRTTRK